MTPTKGNRGSKNGWAETNEEAISVVQRKCRITWIHWWQWRWKADPLFAGWKSMPAFEHVINRFVPFPFSQPFFNVSPLPPLALPASCSPRKQATRCTLWRPWLCFQTCLHLYPRYLRMFLRRVKGRPRSPWLPELYVHCSFCQEHPFSTPFTQLTCT